MSQRFDLVTANIEAASIHPSFDCVKTPACPGLLPQLLNLPSYDHSDSRQEDFTPKTIYFVSFTHGGMSHGEQRFHILFPFLLEVN